MGPRLWKYKHYNIKVWGEESVSILSLEAWHETWGNPWSWRKPDPDPLPGEQAGGVQACRQGLLLLRQGNNGMHICFEIQPPPPSLFFSKDITSTKMEKFKNV